MKRIRWLTAVLVAVFTYAFVGQVALSEGSQSDAPPVLTYFEDWDGIRGLDSEQCEKVGQEGRGEDGWIHWIFATKGGSLDAELMLGGTGSGTYEPGPPLTANTWHFYTPFFDLDGLTATINLFDGDPGPGGGLVISDWCPGVKEELTVSKTADTSFSREHFWDIDKWVETEKGDTVGENNTPKIWLDGPSDYEETATWYVNVTYEDYEDFGYNVSGTVTIENTGNVPAVITDIDDVLAGMPIDVDCDVTLPYTLAVGETLICTYDEGVDSKIEGFNEVTVTTERDEYFADAEIVWGAPATETNQKVTIEDDSDLPEFGVQTLGTVTAPDNAQFTYGTSFGWVDFGLGGCGPYSYDNTATIVETRQSATATLKVNVLCEVLRVTKTAETSFTREHSWDIDKKVETEGGFELEDETPKIWLYADGRGDETATWTVTVTYEGFKESGFNVSGTITIYNIGTGNSDYSLPAVITHIDDVLAGMPIDVDCDVALPYTLAVGETLICTYDEGVDSKIEGFNEVTVTTERDEYSADAEIVWSDPIEIADVITIRDAVSSTFDGGPVGVEQLGEVTSVDLEAGDSVDFTYSSVFAWSDFAECGSYRIFNVASIVGTGQTADAELAINVQCVKNESAWAKGDPNLPFCDISAVGNWGWTNPVEAGTTYTWPLWAGAGQCDTSNGVQAGFVHVTWDSGQPVVRFELFDGFSQLETHVYAGEDRLPTVGRGRNGGRETTAPGQYAIAFEGPYNWIIAHAVVQVPDPNFGREAD